MPALWLPEPPSTTKVCGGFDGSENNDWTAIRLETVKGLSFTPRYGPDRRPTIWNPAEWGGSIPRHEVHVAMEEINRRYAVERFYCDPEDWRSEIGEWAVAYGEKKYLEWPTNKYMRMSAALKTFVTDLRTGALKQDGCPITALHVANARKKAQPRDLYTIQKPHGADHQKIDAAMASVLAHEAARDARADGWTDEPVFSYGWASA
jgi:hypothetical protein